MPNLRDRSRRSPRDPEPPRRFQGASEACAAIALFHGSERGQFQCKEEGKETTLPSIGVGDRKGGVPLRTAGALPRPEDHRTSGVPGQSRAAHLRRDWGFAAPPRWTFAPRSRASRSTRSTPSPSARSRWTSPDANTRKRCSIGSREALPAGADLAPRVSLIGELGLARTVGPVRVMRGDARGAIVVSTSSSRRGRPWIWSELRASAGHPRSVRQGLRARRTSNRS